MARKLQTRLFFPFVRAVRALGAKDVLLAIERAMKDNGGQLTNEAGLQVLGELVERLPDAEDEVLDFLEQFFVKTRDEFEEIDVFAEILPAVKAVFRDVKFPDFVRSALGGTRQNSTYSACVGTTTWSTSCRCLRN